MPRRSVPANRSSRARTGNELNEKNGTPFSHSREHFFRCFWDQRLPPRKARSAYDACSNESPGAHPATSIPSGASESWESSSYRCFDAGHNPASADTLPTCRLSCPSPLPSSFAQRPRRSPTTIPRGEPTAGGAAQNPLASLVSRYDRLVACLACSSSGLWLLLRSARKTPCSQRFTTMQTSSSRWCSAFREPVSGKCAYRSALPSDAGTRSDNR